MSAFAPGPWRVVPWGAEAPNAEYGPWVVLDAAGGVIADGLFAPEARLLAVAPTLYATLRELLEAIAEHTPFPDRQRAAEEAARIALKKVEES